MKKWWIETGWPWFLDNWILVFILPLVLVIWASKGLIDRTGWFKALEVVDPTAKADARALAEAEKRRDELFADKQRLESELQALEKAYERMMRDFDSKLEARVDELRNDPSKLKEFMLRTGRDT